MREESLLSDFFEDTIIEIKGDDNNRIDNPITFLKERQLLSRASFEYLNIPANHSIDLTDKEQRQIEETFEIPKRIIESISRNTLRTAEIIKRIKSLVNKEGKISVIVFCPNLESSKLINIFLQFDGIRSNHIDGATPIPQRESIIQSFKENNINVLCNYEVLSTGFDAPKTDCVFVARPTLSAVLYSQMIGRGLRGPKLGGTPHCHVVTVKDNFINLPLFDQIYNSFDAYWDKKH